ncbi:ABC transporter substrate-binding protein [Cohnella cellulosilytica]|uniref:ABC transporter substrate-binding protein n=1 Tax=Cohnella cellulosilytica TaxID=986710 RepID=A0ABW2F8E3_9BACL
MKQRITSALLLVALTGGLLAGCGSDNKSPSTSTESGNNSEAGVNQEARSVKLNIMLPGLGRFKDSFDGYLKQFALKEKAEKNIEVTYNLELPSDPNLLTTRLASGDAPDIFCLHIVNQGKVFEKGGYLADLSDQPFVGKLLDSAKEVVTINGKVIGLPLETFAWGYLYNKDIFKENDLKVPATLSEMMAVVDTLNKKKIVPFELAYKDNYVPGWVTFLAMNAIADTEIPDWWERMAEGQGSFQEVVDKGVFDIFDLVNANGTKRPLEVGVEDGVADFASGNAAMMITGPWYSANILKVNPDFNLGLAPLPVNDDPASTKVIVAATTTLAVYPKSPNKEVAIDFINYVLDDKDSSALFEAMQFNQVSKTQAIKVQPWTEEGQTYMANGHAYFGKELPSAANEANGKLSQAYFAKQLSKEEYIKQLDEIWKKSVEISK